MVYSKSTARSNIYTLPIASVGPIDTATAKPLTSGDRIVETMRVSGEWLLYDAKEKGNVDIFRVPLAGGSTEQLTTHPAYDFAPDLSPDGRLLAYHSWRTGTRDIFVQPVEGGEAEQVTRTRGQESYPSWLDERSILFFEQEMREYFVVRRNESGGWEAPTPLALPRGIGSVKLSPDKRFFVYGREGSLEISWVGSGKRQVVRNLVASGVGASLGRIRISEDSRTAYFKRYDSNGRASFWSVPMSGRTPPRLLVRFDDPLRPSNRPEFVIGGGLFYFAIDEFRSYIWRADVIEQSTVPAIKN